MSAIEFLNQHDTIDFNTWLKKGVQYFSKNDVELIRGMIYDDKYEEYMDREKFIPKTFHNSNQEPVFAELSKTLTS